MFSLFGSSFTTAHYLSKIYTNPDFSKFIQNFNEGKTPIEVLHQFIINVITSNVDPIIKNDLDSEAVANLFQNENLSNLEKSKILIGKMIKKHLHNINTQTLFPHLVISVPENELKEKLLEISLKLVNEIPDFETVTCPTDVYRISMIHLTNIITGYILVVLGILKTPLNENNFLSQCCNTLKIFNKYYDYKGILSENNDTTSSDEDDDPPRKLKRGRVNKELPTSSDDTKKSKK
ncbi:hypothetical protein Indivirus_1_23 [Indivirus ILV1]|uniref:Uncharacterized protein n=1 Tax=Indivirus ILV1 TaxID=1977633 RepID=A0A1V0SCF8_9VIRU|nr:hypothetical protein Indivirus_1_23 [Indivirus ILV1]